MKSVHEIGIDEHLFLIAGVDALFFVHIELFGVVGLDAVVEALFATVEEEALGSLEIDKSRAVHILIIKFIIYN